MYVQPMLNLQSVVYKYNIIVCRSMEYTSPVWCFHATSDVNCLDTVKNSTSCWTFDSRWHRDKKQWSKSSNIIYYA